MRYLFTGQSLIPLNQPMFVDSIHPYQTIRPSYTDYFISVGEERLYFGGDPQRTHTAFVEIVQLLKSSNDDVVDIQHIFDKFLG